MTREPRELLARVIFPAPAWRERWRDLEAHTGIASRKLARDLRSAIRGTVIEDHHLEFDSLARQRRSKRALEVRLFVPGRNQHRAFPQSIVRRRKTPVKR